MASETDIRNSIAAMDTLMRSMPPERRAHYETQKKRLEAELAKILGSSSPSSPGGAPVGLKKPVLIQKTGKSSEEILVFLDNQTMTNAAEKKKIDSELRDAWLFYETGKAGRLDAPDLKKLLDFYTAIFRRAQNPDARDVLKKICDNIRGFTPRPSPTSTSGGKVEKPVLYEGRPVPIKSGEILVNPKSDFNRNDLGKLKKEIERQWNRYVQYIGASTVIEAPVLFDIANRFEAIATNLDENAQKPIGEIIKSAKNKSNELNFRFKFEFESTPGLDGNPDYNIFTKKDIDLDPDGKSIIIEKRRYQFIGFIKKSPGSGPSIDSFKTNMNDAANEKRPDYRKDYYEEALAKIDTLLIQKHPFEEDRNLEPKDISVLIKIGVHYYFFENLKNK